MATTTCQVPEGYPAEIIGYADPWIVSPGDQVEIKVSTTATEYSHRTVRLIQGLDAPHAPKVRVEEITQIPRGTHKGTFQQSHAGSYALVEDLGFTSKDEGIKLSFFFQPYLLSAGHDQTLISLLGSNGVDGAVVLLGDDGGLKVRVGNGSELEEVPFTYTLVEKQWLHIDLNIHKDALAIAATPMAFLGHCNGEYHQQSFKLSKPITLTTSSILTVAATRPTLDTRPTDYYNGRIEAVSLNANCVGTLRSVLKFDFYLKMSTDSVVDVSGNGKHGVLVNAPTRAVTGHDWDGSETDWTKATYGYGAIHFHEDDLDDARWQTDFTIQIPASARSGAYAVEVKNADDPTVLDNITFFVRPPPTSEAKVALILSTFTYTAYANEHMYDESRSSSLTLTGGLMPRKDENFKRMERRDDLGLSLYDVHRDGSGSVFSTVKRPVLNVRPGFYHWGFDRPREFSADLLMVGFLEQVGIPYDTVTDHDLHARGVNAIKQYSTVITGSHPEYPTLESLNAYSEYSACGGNIMYLGGNGFYWMSVLDPANPHRIEVRRCDQGVRTFGMPGGEWHHSLNGQRGGLWRSRGRSANYLVGIGCCGEGFGPGVAFKPTEAAKDDKFAWVFEGIGSDELVGENGFGGGASGDEIDRWDPVNGSPETAVVLASSLTHSELFGLFPEDFSFQDYWDGLLGPNTRRIRSDIVFMENKAGGKVFSVGSMNWYCSLGWDGYKNNVAKMTENVLRRFAADVA